MNEWLTDPAFRSHGKELQRPAPLGKQLLHRMRVLKRFGHRHWSDAPTQHERLQRMGYVKRQIIGTESCAMPTEAGRAQLQRQSQGPLHDQRSGAACESLTECEPNKGDSESGAGARQKGEGG